MAEKLKVYKQRIDSINSAKQNAAELKANPQAFLKNVLARQLSGKRNLKEDATSAEKKNKDKIRIKYAKEFFINEKGEVIKMAAIVSKDEEVRKALGADKQLGKEIEAFMISTSKDKEEKKKSSAKQ